MTIKKTALFIYHMNAMREHYGSNPSHVYALPVDLVHPTAGDSNDLIAFAEAESPAPQLAELLGAAEKSFTDLAKAQETQAVAAVKAFEAGGGIDAFVAQMKKQEGQALTDTKAALDDTYDKLIAFGTAHPQTQSHIMELTSKLGSFLTKLFSSMGMFFQGLGTDIVHWSQKVVYESAWASITHWFSGAVRSIGHFFTEIGAAAEVAFKVIEQAAKDAWNEAVDLVKKAIEAGEKAILEPIAKALVDGLPINDVRTAWKSVSASNSSAIDIIKAAATGKNVSSEAVAAMSKVRQQMEPHITNFHKQTRQNLSSAALQPYASAAKNSSFMGFGAEFGGSAVYGVGVEGAIGMLAGIPGDDGIGYGSVGVNVGLEEGASVDEAIVFSVGEPKNAGGVYVGIVIGLVAEIGGTVQVGFSFPSFSFSSISIGLAEGLEEQLALDGGYTFIF